MCYVHLDADQLVDRKILPVKTWKDLMHQAWEAGMIHATLTGGECLTYQGFDDLFLYLHSLGCDIAILTNGFLLDDKRIEFFRQHAVSRIQITLYGWNDDVYERVTGKRAFSMVIENARKAMAAGLPVNLITTPSAYLGEDVMETVRLGKSLQKSFSINSAIFTPREETGRSHQSDNPNADQYIRIYQLMAELDGRELKGIEVNQLPPVGSGNHVCDECGLVCGGGRSGFVMDWKGTMIPCNRLEMVRAYPLKDGFQKAWTQINQIVNNWPRVPECEGCAYRDVCNNCAGTMLQYAPAGKQPVEMCETVRYYVQHGVMRIPECEETPV
jgi:radical SAM protein with 4Fe4S-binding SPASM domain